MLPPFLFREFLRTSHTSVCGINIKLCVYGFTSKLDFKNIVFLEKFCHHFWPQFSLNLDQNFLKLVFFQLFHACIF